MVAIDRGSAWTKASLIGSVEDRWRIVAHVRQPTSWGDDELLGTLAARLRDRVAPGVRESVDRLVRDAAPVECESRYEAPVLAIVTASGGGSVGDLPNAAERAGWRVTVPNVDRPGAAHRFVAFRDVMPQAWLVLATRRPTVRGAAETASILAAAVHDADGVPILWVGPEPPGEEVERALLGRDLRYVEDRRLTEALESLLLDVTAGRPVPPAGLALQRSVRALARTADLRVLAVDLGARRASWYLADASDWSGAATHEGGLASRLAAPGRAAELASTLHVELDEARVADAVRTVYARPGTLAEVEDDLVVAQAAARDALGEVLRDARPLGGIDVVVGCGGVLAVASPGEAAQMIVEGVRPLGITQLAIDAAGLLPALGSLEPDLLAEAISALADDLLVPLGAAVISSGGSPGETAMRVRVERPTGGEELVTLRYGQLEVVPLAPATIAELEVELPRGISLGTPRPVRRVRARVTGGSVGLVLDARDMPIVVPRRADDRRAVLAEWHERFALERQRRSAVA